METKAGTAVAETNAGVRIAPYKFDAPELSVDVPWGSGVTLRVFYRKPEDADHETYEAAVIRREIIDESGVLDESNPEPANIAYFDDLVDRAEKYRAGEKESFEQWDAAKCKSLPSEAKSTIVARMGHSDFTLINEDSDEYLFDPSLPMKIRQTFGPEAAPTHEIIYEMKQLTKPQRADYLSGTQSKDKAKKRRTIRTTESHLYRKGKKLFAANLINVSGGEIGRGPYDESTKADYLAQIDGSFQMLVINTMHEYYKRGRE